MTPPSIVERLREVAEEIDVYGDSKDRIKALRSLAGEIEEVAREMHRVFPENTALHAAVDAWASRLAPEGKP